MLRTITSPDVLVLLVLVLLAVLLLVTPEGRILLGSLISPASWLRVVK